jgi:hypothetical protein
MLFQLAYEIIVCSLSSFLPFLLLLILSNLFSHGQASNFHCPNYLIWKIICIVGKTVRIFFFHTIDKYKWNLQTINKTKRNLLTTIFYYQICNNIILNLQFLQCKLQPIKFSHNCKPSQLQGKIATYHILNLI